ncbi:MAG: GNAT family N-acetyltransferase [Candidatus Falkowbacteria bacterium]
MNIINAKQDDLEDILKYSTILNEPEEAKKNIIERCVADNLVWLAKDPDRIVAYVLVELFGSEQKYFSGSVFISELYVDERSRGRGIGSSLIRTALKAEYPSGYDYFSLTHDPDEAWLTGFYERFGFKKIGVTDVGNVMMIKN